MSFGERFLLRPGSVPDGLGERPWGAASVGLQLAGGPVLVQGMSERQAEVIVLAYRAFCRDPGAAAPARVELRRLERAAFRTFPLAGWEYTLDIRHTRDEVLLAGLTLVARIAPLESTATLWTPAAEGDEFRGVFENFLRVVVGYRALWSGGVLLHSAAAGGAGAMALFVGPSGAGKTTISRLSLAAGRRVLSDDLNVVIPGRRGVEVVGVPFAGELRQTLSAEERWPLAAICRLRQGETSGLSRLSRGRALAALVAAAPYVNCDPHRLDALAASLEAILDLVPAYELTFSLAGDFWSLLEPAREVVA
jgi:hypothetical protein